MRNLFKSMISLAVAAMAFTGCSKDTTQTDAPDNMVTMTVYASDALTNTSSTRTHYDETTGRILWDGSTESIYVLEKPGTSTIISSQSKSCTVTDGKAAFTVSFPVNTATDLTYAAVYPATNYITDGYTDMTKIKTILPSEQTPSVDNFDPKGDLMIAMPVAMTSQPSSLSFSFGRIAALGKMTVTNLGIAADEKITSISFSAANKVLAGRNYIDLTTGKAVELGYTSASNTIALDFSNITITNTASFPVWFTCLPADLAAGDSFIVKISTDKFKSYTKTVTLTGTQALAFKAGDISSFTVNMTGVTGEATTSDAKIAVLTYDEVKDGSWTYDLPVVYTTSTGIWTVCGTKQSSAIQINGAKGYIKLPAFTNPITTVIVETNSASKTLMLSATNSSTVADAIVSQGGTNMTQYTLNTAGKNCYTGYLKSDGVMQITKITVITGAAIVMDNITGVPAIGVTNATAKYETISFTGDDDVTATSDGTIVTAVSVDNTTKTVTYTVAANTTNAERQGSITLSSITNDTSSTVGVSQSAPQFEVSPTTITLPSDANSTTTFTLTSDFPIETPTVSDPSKFSVSAPINGVYTVTALADGGSAEAELGTITIKRTIDQATLTVTVKQMAKGQTEIKYVEVTSVDAGEYIIVGVSGGKSYYLPNTPTSARPVSKEIPAGLLSNGQITTPEADMTWTIAVSGGGFSVKSTADATQALGTINNNNGLSIGSSYANNVWTFTKVTPTYAWAIKNTTTNRHIAVYNATNWRTYGAEATNQNGVFRIFKKQ